MKSFNHSNHPNSTSMRRTLPRRPRRQGSPIARRSKHPALKAHLDLMRRPVSPIRRMNDGAICSAFPLTVLQYWLLTEDQLEHLAAFYHQQAPNPWAKCYPCPIDWDSSLTLEEKRLKFGQFIGLRRRDCPPRTEEEIKMAVRRACMEEEHAVLKFGHSYTWSL